MLTEKEIQKIQELYQKHFNIQLTKEQALEKGIALVGIMKLVYQQITEEELELVIKRREETGYITEEN